MNILILSLCHFSHILATVVWIGGIVMILLVILPGAKAALESPMQSRLMKDVAKRFTPMANISILALIVTGIVITYYEKNFTSILDFNNTWNVVLFIKHLLVASMIVIHFYRGLILNPKIGRLSSQVNESQVTPSLSSQVVMLQKFSLNLVKTNFVLGLIVLLFTGILLSL